MKTYTKNLIQLHIAVFLFGFAALFGKFLAVSPIVIVLGRTFFASIALILVLIYSKQKIKLNSIKDFLFLMFIGIIYAIHWFAFFESVQISNVAIAVLTFSTFPVFVTFLEPVFFNEKIRMLDIFTASATLIGVSLVIPRFELTDNFTRGALWGVIAGFTCAILVIACRKYVTKYSSTIIAFYQHLGAASISLPFVIAIKPTLGLKEILLLILLGILFTAVTQTLYISSLTTIKAQLASIITCLEPVYAILFAAVLLNEVPNFRTFIGGIVILGTALYATIKSSKKNNEDVTVSKVTTEEIPVEI